MHFTPSRHLNGTFYNKVIILQLEVSCRLVGYTNVVDVMCSCALMSLDSLYTCGECMASNLPAEWKPRLLKYLCAHYASPLFKYLKPLKNESLFEAQGLIRYTRSYWISGQIIDQFSVLGYSMRSLTIATPIGVTIIITPSFSSPHPLNDLASIEDLKSARPPLSVCEPC